MRYETGRFVELCERLIGPGPKASHVSASETHEIRDDGIELASRVTMLENLLDEACKLARHFAEVAGHPDDEVAVAGLQRVAEIERVVARNVG